ncbi:hypothetical protein V3C99_006599 [Haemonchus contortus]
MFFILLFLSLACDDVQAGITDLNCTNFVDGVFKYAESAVNCRNKISDANCLILYEAAVEYNTENDRNAKCGGNPPDPQLVQAAIDTCPKTCGYCCLTPAFLCQNKQQPRVPCSSVTEEMCESQAWKTILTEDCPNVCGFCDSAPGCNLDNAFICQSINLQSFVQKYCKRTCGLCNTSSTTSMPLTQAPGIYPGPQGSSTICGSNQNCPTWVQNGFCQSSFYTNAQKMQYCGRECQLC